ncbi:aminopeptidase [Neobacillus sp. D3-1R]|uniref:aminopeptidase n=1 Tax=Neobacillus sp. D3-1R TaxID=3445778 RepID=UPI003FA0F04F
MRNERLVKLAKMLIHHSTKLGSGERVLIRGHIIAKPLILELIDQVYSVGAYPYFEIYDDEIERQMALGYQAEQLETSAKWELQRYQDIDAIITIIGEDNDSELQDVPAEKFQMKGELFHKVDQFFINQRKWVLLRYPTKSLAQKAKMNTSQFEDFLLNVSTIDYGKMEMAMKPLVNLMNKTDKVRILSPGTDLTFSIKGMPAIACFGEKNIPDGEIYTAPIKNSIEGTITFNTPCIYRGITFHNVTLFFKNGKIVEVYSDQTLKLTEIFQTDEGASFIGEFAIGVNPLINHPMGDVLFDEKINGSIHLTPGQAYENADNGNNSTIHWDMVLIHRPEYGGGEIYFDDVLIRKDGLFTLSELQELNPEHLTSNTILISK